MSYYSDLVLTGLSVAPAGYWRADETSDLTTLADASGNGRPGAYPDLGAKQVPGLLADDASPAGEFGAGRYADIPAGSWMNTPRVAATLWIKPSALSGNHWLIGHDRSGTPTELGWRVDVDANKVRFILHIGGSYRVVTSTTSLTGLTSYFVAATYDGLVMRLYINGALEASLAIAGSVGASAQPIHIARMGNGLATYYGVLDEIAVFPAALTADDVAALYAGGTVPPEPVPTQPPKAGVASHIVRHGLGLEPAQSAPGAPHFFTWQSPDGAGWAHHRARSDGLIGYTITHGRREPLGRPSPAVVVVTLLVPIGDPAPDIGELFRLAIAAEVADVLDLAPADAVRATVKITDTEADPTYAKALPGHGLAIRHTVTGTARLAREQARPMDGTGWFPEPSGARAARVLSAIGLAGSIDAGGPTLEAPDSPQNVGAALAAIADSTPGAQIVDQRDGTVDYHGRDHRRHTPIRAAITAAKLLAVNFTWRKSVGDVINRATVATADGEQVTVADTASEDPLTGAGPYPISIATLLRHSADAAGLATQIISRRSRPSYQLPAVTVDLARSIDITDDLPALLALRAADRITLGEMPAGSPWDALPYVFVEGYTETATAYAWRIAYVVSDPLQTGAPLRWIDVPPGVSWSDVRPGVSWLDSARTDDPTAIT